LSIRIAVPAWPILSLVVLAGSLSAGRKFVGPVKRCCVVSPLSRLSGARVRAVPSLPPGGPASPALR